MRHELSSTYSFAIEPDKKKLRLTVFKNDREFVCRKENRKNLIEFLSGQDKQVFKGRLQLMKAAEIISIQVKGDKIGEITEKKFKQLLFDF